MSGYRKAYTCAVILLAEATGMFVMVDYVGEMTVKKFCKYGEYG